MYIKCEKITEGCFSNEVAVTLKLYDGSYCSLFVDKEHILGNRLKVKEIGGNEEAIDVLLPSESFEAGERVIIKRPCPICGDEGTICSGKKYLEGSIGLRNDTDYPCPNCGKTSLLERLKDWIHTFNRKRHIKTYTKILGSGYNVEYIFDFTEQCRRGLWGSIDDTF